MRIKSIVQTGPKTHDGGVREDLVKVEYQGAIAEIVKIDPIHPAICGIARDKTSLIQSENFMIEV